jgi:mycothiol synthase
MRLRPPGPDDVDGVLAVITARDVADLGARDFTREDLLEEWGLSDFSLAHDAAVVENDQGRIVGYGAIRRMGALVAVAPEDEGRGIGTELLRFAEQRQRELGVARHRQWIAAANERGQALLRRAGYAPVRSYWRLERPLTQLDPEPEVPAGLALRHLDAERDGAELHAIDDAAFASLPDYEPQSLAAFREEHLQAHDLDPELSWIAERESDRRLVAFLLARRRREESVGYVDILAVAPDHQGRGLGGLMLRRAMAGFAAAGLARAQLGVASDNPRALRLYERAGMTVRFRVDTVERTATAGSV